MLEEQVNPSIAAHGGRADLVAVEDSSVYLRLSGGCQGCGMAKATLSQGIEVILREAIPEIANIVDVTDHADGTNPYYEPPTADRVVGGVRRAAVGVGRARCPVRRAAVRYVREVDTLSCRRGNRRRSPRRRCLDPARPAARRAEPWDDERRPRPSAAGGDPDGAPTGRAPAGRAVPVAEPSPSRSATSTPSRRRALDAAEADRHRRPAGCRSGICCPRARRRRGPRRRRWSPACCSAAAADHFGRDLVLAPFCVFFALLVAVSVTDLSHRLVPRRLLYGGAGPDRPPAGGRVGRRPHLARPDRGRHRRASVAFGLFFAVWWFIPRGMGFGDVRLAGVIGITVGYLSLLHAYVAFLAGFLVGMVFGLV